MLAVDKVSFAHEDQAVISDFSLNADPGSLIVLKGANGSGKTTLLKLLCGLLEPDGGTISIKGEKPDDDFAYLIYLGHKSGLKTDLSVRDNLAVLTALTGRSSAVSAEEALGRVGLAGKLHTLCGQLSAGQRKRVCLARLMMCKADIWMLDEPFANLDTNGTELLQKLLAIHTEKNMAVVTSPESLSFASSNAQELTLD